MDLEQIRKMISATSQETSVYVGCDSQIVGSKTNFVKVIIVHYDSKHGAKIFHESSSVRRRMSLRERLWQEVIEAATLADSISDAVGMRYFCVHLDLNSDPMHKSNVIVNEAINYVKSLGYDVRVKPFAFASSYAADHYCRK